MTDSQALLILFSLFQGIGLLVLNSFKQDLREMKNDFRSIARDLKAHLEDHAKGAFSN